MTPCPICGANTNSKNGKLLPTKQKLKSYCNALGVDSDIFKDIRVRRYICFHHFPDNEFYIVEGQNHLRRDALPKRLSDDERIKMKNFCVPPSRPLKFSNMPSTSRSSGECNASSGPEPDMDAERHSENNDEPNLEEQQKQGKHKYVLVEVEKLLELLECCPKCHYKPKNAKPVLTFVGSACISNLWCQECGSKSKWSSQNHINGSQRFVGNVDIASAATLVPITFSSLKEFAFILDMPMISETTFYRISPTVWNEVEKAYHEMQSYIVNRLKQKDEVNLGADGQFDSRGYSAYLCSVTFMDAESQLIVATVCLDKREENCPSTELEKKGVEIGMGELLEKGLRIASLCTDRSKSIIFLMRTKFSSIRHFFDAWHVIKGKAKELRLECKNKRAVNLKVWCQALLNHMWWSINSANGDGNKCMLFIISGLLHVLDIHSWPAQPVLKVLHDNQATVMGVPKRTVLPNDPYELQGEIIADLNFNEHQECGHTPPTNKVALDPTSKTYGVLQKALTSDNFLNDVQNCSPVFATSANESYHSVKTNKYCTKNYYYNKNGFIRRTHLAVLDHNHKRLDEETGKRKVIGKKAYRHHAKHRDGEFVTKVRKSPPDFTWKKILATKVLENLPKIEKKLPKANDGTEDECSDQSDMHDSELEENPRAGMKNMILNQFGLESEYESDDAE